MLDCDGAGTAERSYLASKVRGGGERSYPASEVWGSDKRSYPMSEVLPHAPTPRPGAMAGRTNPMSK